METDKPKEEDDFMAPRVFNEFGLPIAWWSDRFQEELNNHPEIKKIVNSKNYDKTGESNE